MVLNKNNQTELTKKTLEDTVQKVNIFESLVEIFGGPVASKVFNVLSSNTHRKELVEISKLVNENFPVKEAMQKVFGNQYETFINNAKKANAFIYESDEANYKKISIDNNLSKVDKVALLRVEFNLNISELQIKENPKAVQSYAKTILYKWTKRYGEIIGFENQEEKDKLKEISKILNPNTKTFKDLFQILRPLFGVTGVMSIIYAVLLFTGLGMGIIANISIFFVGVPGGQIAAAVLVSTILVSLSMINLGVESKIQAVIQSIYKILDNKEALYAKDNIISEQELLQDELDIMLINDEKNSNIDNATMLSIVSILKYMIEIDGVVSPKEIDIYLKYMNTEFGYTINEAKKFMNDIPALDNIQSIEFLNTILTIEQKTLILKVLKDIVIVDSQINREERQFLASVKKVFLL